MDQLLLNKKKIIELLKAKAIDLEIFDSVTSTNDCLKNSKSDNKIKACLAEQQTQGRGRFNRSWHSPFGQNIYLSLAYPFAKTLSELAGLSIVVALSICKSIDEIYHLPNPVLIKWPNDIIYDVKKLAGNLIEIQTVSNNYCLAIIGIGINVNMLPDNNHAITQPWISIKEINKSCNDRNILCAQLLDNLLDYLDKFSRNGLPVFLQEWQNRDYLYNKTIALQSGNHQYKGEVAGINAQGHLLLDTEAEGMLQFSAGDTSIIKGN
jgi:BirA family biotin operon repressor/biotin-[acetyl-CoA-carboxylase] ligase